MMSLSEDSRFGSRLGVGGSSSKTISFNAETVTTHGHLKEAVDAPVSSPRIAAIPELLSGVTILAVSSDRDLMINHREPNFLGVDAVVLGGIISQEAIGNVNTTRDRTVLGDFSFHLVNSFHLVVIADVVARITHGPAFVLSRLSSRGWRPSAIFAFVNGSYLALKVGGDVLLA